MELKLENVTYSYRKGKDALKDVKAQFGPGIHLLLGPNGAGKTTLLKVIAGLLKPQSGECILDKECTAYHSPHSVKEIFLLDDECRFPLKTINDMASLHAVFYPNFSQEFLTVALEMFGMTGRESLADMSLGNRRKAQLAYALALGTQVLMLDEPANGLDMTSKKALANIVARAMNVNDNRCIIVATHTVQEMRNLFDWVTIINQGSIVLNTSIAHICERLAFVRDTAMLPGALIFEPSIEGPTQIIPNNDNAETPIDFPLLYSAAVGPNFQNLKDLLS